VSKVNGNDPAHPAHPEAHWFSGMPIRLEIASRILAGMGVNAFQDGITQKEFETTSVQSALRYADALIAEHNATCGDPAPVTGAE
jgi:hypothetical protein